MGQLGSSCGQAGFLKVRTTIWRRGSYGPGSHSHRAYLGRKPSYTRALLDHVRALPGQEAVGIARIATEDWADTADGLSHQG